jgi:hypothetical protein
LENYQKISLNGESLKISDKPGEQAKFQNSATEQSHGSDKKLVQNPVTLLF